MGRYLSQSVGFSWSPCRCRYLLIVQDDVIQAAKDLSDSEVSKFVAAREHDARGRLRRLRGRSSEAGGARCQASG
eukprot:3802-Hanusia_phi.AAC.1